LNGTASYAKVSSTASYISTIRANTGSIANLATSTTVVFSTPFPSTNYAVTFGFEGTLSVAAAMSSTGKTNSGFTASIVGITSGATFDYIAAMRQ
jgi:hypothetical protein